MKRWLLFFLLFTALPAWAANVAPLGLEIGAANLSTVKSALDEKTLLREAGINKWTGGPMLISDGKGLDVEGLEEILFIFGKDNKLDGVIMTMGKHRLKEVAAALRKKYKPVHENFPFVGSASATYRKGESVVYIGAPHLSFSMNVSYLSDRFDKAFKKAFSAEEAERRKRQEEKF